MGGCGNQYEIMMLEDILQPAQSRFCSGHIVGELAIPRLLDFLLYAEAHRILSRSRKPPSGTTSAFKDGNNWIDQLITENTSIIQVYYINVFFLKWSIDAYGCLWYILNSKEHYYILFFLMLRRIQSFRI